MLTNVIARTCRNSSELLARRISETSSVPYNDFLTPRLKSRTEEDQLTHTSSAKCMKLGKHNIRALLTVKANLAPQTFSKASKDESREFMSYFPEIVRNLTETDGGNKDIGEVMTRYAKVLQYTVPNGKKYRGLSVVNTYKMIETPENLTPQNIRLANLLGWCLELLQASLLMTDDLMDRSVTRRGTPCWYKVEGVGLQAVNDALLVENSIYSLLKSNFSAHHCYVPAMELINEMIVKTCLGQSLDLMSHVDGRPRLDAFTMNRYTTITKYKTAYYSLQLPVALAMYLAGNYDEEIHRQAETIMIEIGQLVQVQDDFLDCFGDPDVTGKIGTDIRYGKCSWLVVVALQRATPEQRKILEENYGKHDAKCEMVVRDLYEELGLPNMYATYEEESYNLIRTHIQQISKRLPHNVFLKFMDKIYQRES